MLGGNILDDLQDDRVSVLPSELKLACRDLPVPGLEGDTHLEALVQDLHPALVGRGCGWSGEGEGATFTQLLVARGEIAHDDPPGERQVRVAEGLLLFDEEDLLPKGRRGPCAPPEAAAS